MSLKSLESILEKGNFSFNMHQTIEDPTRIIIWESFTYDQAFKEHLCSPHLQDFIKLDLVELEMDIQQIKSLENNEPQNTI